MHRVAAPRRSSCAAAFRGRPSGSPFPGAETDAVTVP